MGGRPVIVTAGSYTDGVAKSSEIWDFTVPGSQWQSTEPLPIAMLGGLKMATTSQGDGLIMTYGKGVYTFNCTSETSCKWSKEHYSLQIRRMHHAMLPVYMSFLENC